MSGEITLSKTLSWILEWNLSWEIQETTIISWNDIISWWDNKKTTVNLNSIVNEILLNKNGEKYDKLFQTWNFKAESQKPRNSIIVTINGKKSEFQLSGRRVMDFKLFSPRGKYLLLRADATKGSEDILIDTNNGDILWAVQETYLYMWTIDRSSLIFAIGAWIDIDNWLFITEKNNPAKIIKVPNISNPYEYYSIVWFSIDSENIYVMESNDERYILKTIRISDLKTIVTREIANNCNLYWYFTKCDWINKEIKNSSFFQLR